MDIGLPLMRKALKSNNIDLAIKYINILDMVINDKERSIDEDEQMETVAKMISQLK